jgi:hypothetical protein
MRVRRLVRDPLGTPTDEPTDRSKGVTQRTTDEQTTQFASGGQIAWICPNPVDKTHPEDKFHRVSEFLTREGRERSSGFRVKKDRSLRHWICTAVIRSQKDWYESSGLVCHPNMMSLNTHTSRHWDMEFRTHMKHTTIHRQNHLVRLLHLSVQFHFHTLCSTWWSWSKQQCLFSTISFHVIPRHSTLTPGRPALYTTTHSLFPILLSTSHTETCVQGIKKKLGSSCVIYRFVVILQHKSVKPVSKQMMKQAHFSICFLDLSEQLNHILHPGMVKNSQFRKIWKVVRVRY